jgi:undecaprenyl-phosphate 4-deoxy-4-formamido-L-arabinose transferase
MPESKNNAREINNIDVVIPVFNEAANLDALIERSINALKDRKYGFRLIFVDDGSSDNSVAVIEKWIVKNKKNIAVISLNRNYGQHAAITAGFESCTGDVVVTIDADLQNPPEGIPTMIDKMNEGDYDIVSTLRGGGRKDNCFRHLASSAKDYMVRKITDSNMRDSGCMLRAYRKEIIDVIIQCKERFIYIPVLADSFANKTAEIVVEHSERASGDSKYNVWKLMQLFFDILTGSSFMPLRFLTVFGGIMSVVSILFSILLIVLRLFHGAAWANNGVFTLFAILFFFIGIQFFIFGILGEYICRISMDVRKRPKYLVSFKKGNIENK